MQLSIAMIVKNEEKNLETTLKSVQSIKEQIDAEIIIVDTGSKDRTVEIARKYTDKVFIHKWEDDFAKMRNISISYCKGDWILVLDADEEIDNPDYIVNLFLTREIYKYNSATVKIKNFSDSLRKDSSIINIHRLFKRDKDLKYIGIIHEVPVYKKTVLISKLMLNHNGYINDDYTLAEYKFIRNTELLLKTLERNGEDIYIYFQLAQSYLSVNRVNEGLNYLNKSISMINNNELLKKYIFVKALYYKIVYTLNEYDKCIEVCKEVMKVNNNILDTYYFLCFCYYKRGNYSEAIKYGEKYLNTKKNRCENNEVIDINIEEFSFDKEDNIKEVIIDCYRILKKYNDCYKFIKLNEALIEKDSVLDCYFETIVMMDKIDDIKSAIRIENNNKYDYFFNSINNKLFNLDKDNKDSFLKMCLEIDRIVKVYIKIVLLKEKVDINEVDIDFDIFSNWKAEILLELIKNNDLSLISSIDKDSIRNYINYVTKDFQCVSILLKYSKDNIFTVDLEKLIILDNIEEMLIYSNKVKGEDFKLLVYRRIINKVNLINYIYKEEVLDLYKYKNILSREEKFWYQLRRVLDKKEENLLEAIRSLKLLIKEDNSYKEVYKIIQEELESGVNNDIMLDEKIKILRIVDDLVNSGDIDKAKSIICNLEDIVGKSSEIYNVKGVIAYIEGDFYSALEELLKGNIINSRNKDILYNIDQILIENNCNKN